MSKRIFFVFFSIKIFISHFKDALVRGGITGIAKRAVWFLEQDFDTALDYSLYTLVNILFMEISFLFINNLYFLECN